MKITDVIQLLKAGYTKAEIDELRKEPEIGNDPSSQGLLPSNVSGEKAGEDPGLPSPEQEEIAKLKQMVSNLQNLVQKQNIQNSELKPVEPESAVDILASLINPKKE